MHTSIAIICTQLNGFKYYYITLIILFNINLFAHTQWFQVLHTVKLLFNTDNSIQHLIHLQTVKYFHILLCKTVLWDPIRYYYSWSVDLQVMTMKGYSIFPKALELEPHYQRHSLRVSYFSAVMQLYFAIPANWA